MPKTSTAPVQGTSEKSLADLIREAGSVDAAASQLGTRPGSVSDETLLRVNETCTADFPVAKSGNSDGAKIVFTHAVFSVEKGGSFTVKSLVERCGAAEAGARRKATTAIYWIKQLVKSGHLERV